MKVIDNNTLEKSPGFFVGGVVYTLHEEEILVMNQYTHFVKGKHIYSSPQLESYGNYDYDRLENVQGGKQSIKTLDGFIIPLDMISGLTWIKLKPYTDDE